MAVKIEFREADIGEELRCNGNAIVKKPSRTALLVEYGRTFYFSADTICERFEWSVVVGNIGQVFRGGEKAAREKFKRYCEISNEGVGRAAGEYVSLWCETERDGEQPVEEFMGTNTLTANFEAAFGQGE